jgi:hypothetical protein
MRNENVNEPQNQQSCQNAVSGSRLTGKTNVMILSMIPELEKGGKVGVAGCTDPKDITERLKAKGIEVKSEPMIRKGQAQPIYDEEGIIGFENSDDIQTGFLFYCH